MTRADRIPHQDWQPELGGDGIVAGLDDLDQCIHLILETPKGSDPQRPEFGSDCHRYVDWPQNRVTPHLVREAVTAIRRWEPRVEVIAVTVEHEVAHVALIVEWRPVAGGATQRSRVELPR